MVDGEADYQATSALPRGRSIETFARRAERHRCAVVRMCALLQQRRNVEEPCYRCACSLEPEAYVGEAVLPRMLFHCRT